ncbi:MAG: hypothetical protein GC160_12615 [Acidobacteria bacterium]|nr:hypothetical protein [Acidobacteriota bacterium]
MKRPALLFTAPLLTALLLAPAIPAAAQTPDFPARVKDIIESHAHLPADALPRAGYGTIAAKLALKEDPELCSRRMIELLDDVRGDMFWMFPVTAIAYLDQGQLTDEARRKLREAWRTYMPYRGDTENHWLLYYTSLYLYSQLYPDDPAETWYTGKSSAESRAEAEEYIFDWMNLTATLGQGEYDCTHYIGVYLLPLSYLAAWSENPVMRERATRMMEWIMADFAVESLDGVYVGAHARTDDKQVVEKWDGVSSDFAWLLFGQGYPHRPYPAFYALLYSLASAYEPPQIIQRIATDRSKPYLHKELKRTRHRWRFTDVRNAPVYKTTYMSKDYAVGSDQGGILQPIQQHSWDVTWALDDPRGVRNTIFSMHPYSGNYELQMYFPPMLDAFLEAVVRSKTTYDSPDKLLGGSPFEKIFQDQDTVIALYDIPESEKFPHINGFFPDGLEALVEHESGWIFAHASNAYVAYRPLAPYEWKPIEKGGRRLYSPSRRNGTILQAASASEFASFEEFQRKITALPLEFALEPVPTVRFRSLRGHELAFTYGRTPSADGRPLDYAGWKSFEGPFLNADAQGRKLTLTHGGQRRVLDFTDLP